MALRLAAGEVGYDARRSATQARRLEAAASRSWLQMVGIFLGFITRQAIPRRSGGHSPAPRGAVETS